METHTNINRFIEKIKLVIAFTLSFLNILMTLVIAIFSLGTIMCDHENFSILSFVGKLILVCLLIGTSCSNLKYPTAKEVENNLNFTKCK